MSTHCVEFLCEVCAKTERERERERERGPRHIVRWLPVTAAELISFYFHGKEWVSNLKHTASMKCPRKTRALPKDRQEMLRNNNRKPI
jgi:hypothetical protein